MTSLLLSIPAFLIILASGSAQAADVRTYLKTSPTTATVTIKTEDNGAVQAANFVDAWENSQFVDMMMTDAQSDLAVLKKQIEMDVCKENSTTPDGLIPGCGRVEISNFVRTSFGRGGWMAAGASYAFFLGFRYEGSGHFLESYFMISINESVQADVDAQLNYLGSVQKYLTLEKITPLTPPGTP